MTTLISQNYSFSKYELLEHPPMVLIFLAFLVDEGKRYDRVIWEPIQTFLFIPYRAILIPISFMTVGLKLIKEMEIFAKS